MAYVMHIAFDNGCRLKRNTYYFKYNDVKFKLIQNKEDKDVLLSILQNHTETEEEKVYSVASEFLSALGWQNNSHITMEYIGGWGARRQMSLKQARCSHYVPCFLPISYRRCIGNNLNLIPHIEDDEQRKALALYREGRGSLNPYLSFLFYWHILEVGRKTDNRVDWINRVLRAGEVYIDSHYLQQLPRGRKSLGRYFKEDCRHAIAHFIRRPGRRILKIDSYVNKKNITVSSTILEKFTRYHIKKYLKLSRRRILVRKYGTGFPEYISEETIERDYRYPIAYN